MKLDILNAGLPRSATTAKELIPWQIFSLTTCLEVVGYFLASFFAAKAFVVIRYGTVLYAAFLALILQISFPLIYVAMRSGLGAVIVALMNSIWAASFWPLYVAAALIGVRLAKPSVITILDRSIQRTRPPEFRP